VNRIIVLTDYRNAFYSTFKTRNTTLTMNVAKIADRLSECGYEIDIYSYGELRLDSNFSGLYVLYTSSEDDGLEYKSYIEDIVLHLENMGAIPLPAYKFLRAHHNKAMMELLRYELFPDSAHVMATQVLGTLEELQINQMHRANGRPKVVKSAYGAGARWVGQAENGVELERLARQYSRSAGGWFSELKEVVKTKFRKQYQRRSTHRNKFIVQEMIPGLRGDFKVLCMGGRYYCLYRENRKDDFRASGSGLFTWDIAHVVNESALLDYAEQTYTTLDTPLASLDIAFDGQSFHLIEFQALHFGTLTAEHSKFHYARFEGRWEKKEAVCTIEEVLSDAIDVYIQRKQFA